MRENKNMEAAFTLIELMIVITIIGILLAALGFAVVGAQKSARKKALIGSIQFLHGGVDAFKSRHGKLPESRDRLAADALLRPAGSLEAALWLQTPTESEVLSLYLFNKIPRFDGQPQEAPLDIEKFRDLGDVETTRTFDYTDPKGVKRTYSLYKLIDRYDNEFVFRRANPHPRKWSQYNKEWLDLEFDLISPGRNQALEDPTAVPMMDIDDIGAFNEDRPN